MVYVYVLDKHGKPLMPTTRCGHVRRLLKSGKAVVVSTTPFTIRLKYESTHFTQPVHEGIDTGRENIGDAASLEDGRNVFLADVKTHNKSIKKKMVERAGFRRERRRHRRIRKQRRAMHDQTTMQKGKADTVRTKRACQSVEITYPSADNPVTQKVIQGKESKFANRRRPDGWITPSARQVIQITMDEIKQTAKILPVTDIYLERVAFDFQKLENTNIRKWQYGKGPLYGYKTYKDYIWDEQHGKCACCGKPIEEYHHIHHRAEGGIDNVKNIIGLCHHCHEEIHNSKEAEDRLMELKQGALQKYCVGLLNSVMPALIDAVQAYCDEHGLTLTATNGKTTSETRDKYGLEKDHCIDAYAISLAERDVTTVRPADTIYMKRRFKKKTKALISTRNQRVYKLDGKAVAYNRHKALNQKTDSLEELLVQYKGSHSAKDVQKLMHRMKVEPARRTYTYRKQGLVAPVRPGDLVLYRKVRKVKGDVKTEVFSAVSVEYTEVVKKTNGVVTKERDWKIGVDDNRVRKSNCCSVLNHSCVQFTGSEPTSEYLKKVEEEAAERKKKAAKKAAEHKTKAAEGAAKASA